MRILHLSDLHVWRYALNPKRLFSRRAIGMLELLSGRARRFPQSRLGDLVTQIKAVGFDHLLITGDLTTTALPAEFEAALEALSDLLIEPEKVSVVPGNHDRYTSRSWKTRVFESYFGAFMPRPEFPWLRRLDGETAILGLDPTRSGLSARGYLNPAQLSLARSLIENRPRRLIVACHYPVAAPPGYQRELEHKRLKNAQELVDWLAGIGPHAYCCGHVHAAWAYQPPELPGQLGLNAGAPLMRDPKGLHLPGFLEITLDRDDVKAVHHAWDAGEWDVFPLAEAPSFFSGEPGRVEVASAP